ncbi:hypothetical protein RUND412_002175 [Rhizina undulata]
MKLANPLRELIESVGTESESKIYDSYDGEFDDVPDYDSDYILELILRIFTLVLCFGGDSNSPAVSDYFDKRIRRGLPPEVDNYARAAAFLVFYNFLSECTRATKAPKWFFRLTGKTLQIIVTILAGRAIGADEKAGNVTFNPDGPTIITRVLRVSGVVNRPEQLLAGIIGVFNVPMVTSKEEN